MRMDFSNILLSRLPASLTQLMESHCQQMYGRCYVFTNESVTIGNKWKYNQYIYTASHLYDGWCGKWKSI
jgi:hypothetical protein